MVWNPLAGDRMACDAIDPIPTVLLLRRDFSKRARSDAVGPSLFRVNRALVFDPLMASSDR
jgi:hypothetical protein